MAGTERLDFASSEGTATIRATLWWPEGGPKAVVQLVHGMAEHISRYDAFASYLASRGFLVCGHDQLGHGDSCPPERWGCLPARTGRDVLVADVGILRGIVERRAPGVPFFLFGHSMGSFVVRAYVSRRGEGLAGAVICGTGFVPPATSAAGNAVARLVCLVRGEDFRSSLLHGMADGAYAKAVPAAQTPFDWLSYNRDNVRAYLADPACGYLFSAGGYATLTALTRETCDARCAAGVPRELPLYYVAGADDPVGDFGRGVEQAYRLALDADASDARLRLWPGMRHEILNEDGRQAVYDDLAQWMEERL